ncbi:hypothetical protein D3C74_50720 [compost metagenome]
MAEQNKWVLENFGRVDFQVDQFDRQIYQKGARITWEKSCLCSCLDIHTGQADYNCPACGGKGYTYFDPEPIRAVVSGITGDKNQLPVGLLDVGTSFVTTMSKDAVGFRDRLIFEDFETAYSQIIAYDENGIKLKYPSLELVAVRVLSTTLPKESLVLDHDNQTLHIDSSHGFKNGERLAILYRIKPVYVVIDIPHELRGTFVKFGKPDEQWTILPRQFLIKREDLLPLQRGDLTT